MPAGIPGEAASMIERRGGAYGLDASLADLQEGAFTLDCGEEDLARIRALVARYVNPPLGFADVAVIACAEPCGGWILPFDRRDFVVVAGEGTITIL